MTTENPIIVWFRRDLRIADNPALSQAAAQGPVLPVFILDEDSPHTRPMGGAQKVFMHQCLNTLKDALPNMVLRRGPAAEIIARLAQESHAKAVYTNRDYDPASTKLEARLTQDLAMPLRTFRARLLYDPWESRQESGDPYRVFTPFWKHMLTLPEPDRPLPPPKTIALAQHDLASEHLKDWHLLPQKPDWSEGIRKTFPGGEAAAHRRLNAFGQDVERYHEERNRPDLDTSSHLSADLACGILSPNQIWHAISNGQTFEHLSAGKQGFLRQLGWREFHHHALFHMPDLGWKNLNKKFDAFDWQTQPTTALKAWQQGQTGYPIVDAGMRQLWAEGWQHNRVRLICASFLTKDLMIHWRKGESWYWDTLVDADPANNPGNWQWTAGCGLDAAPFFRIFNPVKQGQRFDPDGAYVRRWVPELNTLSADNIHAPWDASPQILEAAGIQLGSTYPTPIVDHQQARQKALAAFEKVKHHDS